MGRFRFLFHGRRLTTYANSLHLWKMRLPENLGVGTHQIEVRATDPFGRKFLQKSSYRIERAYILKDTAIRGRCF